MLVLSELKWVPHDFPRFENSFCAAIENGDGELEVAGCGMLTRETLRQIGFAPQQWSGFAFGIGLERITMLKHGIADIHVALKLDAFGHLAGANVKTRNDAFRQQVSSTSSMNDE